MVLLFGRAVGTNNDMAATLPSWAHALDLSELLGRLDHNPPNDVASFNQGMG